MVIMCIYQKRLEKLMQGTMTNVIPLFIADTEAQKFLIFQQYYEPVSVMIESGVFDIKYGSAILNFEAGIIKTIQRNDVLYSMRHKSV